jgi:hypothetical protein
LPASGTEPVDTSDKDLILADIPNGEVVQYHCDYREGERDLKTDVRIFEATVCEEKEESEQSCKQDHGKSQDAHLLDSFLVFKNNNDMKQYDENQEYLDGETIKDLFFSFVDATNLKDIQFVSSQYISKGILK